MTNKEKEVLLKAIIKYIDLKEINKLQKIANTFHPKDLYLLIQDLPTNKITFFIRILNQEQAAELFDELSHDQQEEIISNFTKKELGEIFESLYVDEAIDIIEEMPTTIVKRILESVDADTRKRLNTILKYDPSWVASKMHVEVVSIKANQSIKQAKSELKKIINKEEKEIAGVIYVHDESNKFLGYVKPDSIFSESDEKPLRNFVSSITPLRTYDQMNLAQKKIYSYEIPSVPIVDYKNRLVGVIEADDIVERFEHFDEAISDNSLVKATKKSYMESTSWELFKSRVSWIVLLIIIGTLTQIVIVGFQAIWSSTGFWAPQEEMLQLTITTVATLAFTTAISVSSSINDAAGNSGAQSSSTLIRSLALGEIMKQDYKKAIKKETLIGFYLGIAAALTSILRTFFVWAIFGQLNTNDPLLWGWLFVIASISALSFAVAIILGNMIGAILPILAHKRNWDGAVISGPVQTTIVDILTFTIYLGLTTAIFVPLALNGAFGIAPSSSGTSEILQILMSANFV